MEICGEVAKAAVRGNSSYPNLAASLLALIGLWMYENLWIKAGQALPLS